MVSLRDIRRRIHSAENIEQITKAMEMVAAARLRHAQMKVEQTRPYAAKLDQILAKLSAASSDFIHPLITDRPVNKTGIVVIGADKGLCGPYNASVLAAADKLLENYQPDNASLVVVGRKASEHYQRKRWPIKNRYRGWEGKSSFGMAKKLSNDLVDWFVSGEVDEILLVYTQFVTVMTRRVVIEKFLKIDKPVSQKADQSLSFIFEPSPEHIYTELLPRYTSIKILKALEEAYASELAARVMSMRTANKNAGEMITNLTLLRNKVRQANITREMLEITSGAEGIQ
jgi:F-type H+-transporting ATPase subunit gamma